MPEVELLDKTEIWVEGVSLTGADLREIAATAAATLGLRPDTVFVTDVRDARVVLDVIQPRVELGDALAKEGELLRAIATIEGVAVASDAAVHSRGVLGVIGIPESQAPAVLAAATEAEAGVRSYVLTRVAVVSTGGEVVAGDIADTNAVAVATALRPAGYEVTGAGAVADDETQILGRVLRLVSAGYGVVITTGGVGAEDKDRTIEALQQADPHFATAVLASYEVGHGRHVKPHVRVGVGQVGWTRVIALPGPTREVDAAMPVIIEALDNGWDNQDFAESIAGVLRNLLRPQPPAS